MRADRPERRGQDHAAAALSGLARPSAGEMSVLGAAPRQDPVFLAEVGFLAQEIPLYRRFTAEEHISIGAHRTTARRAAGARPAEVASIPLQPRGRLDCLRGPRAQLALIRRDT